MDFKSKYEARSECRYYENCTTKYRAKAKKNSKCSKICIEYSNHQKSVENQ